MWKEVALFAFLFLVFLALQHTATETAIVMAFIAMMANPITKPRESVVPVINY